MAPKNLWHFYVRKGLAYIPTVAQTEAGFFIDIEPVLTLPVSDRERLIQAIASMVSRANVCVPTPARSDYGTPVVVTAAGVKTWATFEKIAQLYKIYRTDTEYEIPRVERTDRGWMDSPYEVKRLPLSLSHEEVARILVEQVPLAA